jgi:aryl-alcohol dehydrogenase-like predicted oxidoreductase
MQQAERSLRALETDRIDVYHLHGPDLCTPFEETLQALDDLQRQGKVLYIGVSNFSAWRLAALCGQARVMGIGTPVVHQIGYNLVSRTAEQEVIPAGQHYDIAITAYGALNGGLLAGTSVLSREIAGRQRFQENKASTAAFSDLQIDAARRLEKLATEWGHEPGHVALAWLASKSFHAASLIGPETVAELRSSAAAMHLELDAFQIAQLDALAAPPPAWEVEYQQRHSFNS